MFSDYAFIESLAAFDEAFARGLSPDLSRILSLPPGFHSKWVKATGFLKFMEGVWRRQEHRVPQPDLCFDSSNTETPADRFALGPYDILGQLGNGGFGL